MQFGRTYEEFEVGAIYRHWPGKTITESDDHLFCLITMNHHPLHLDANYAETSTQFGRNVVVGNLIYSVLLGMSVPDVSGKAIANLEVESLRHVAPTFHGDTIYGESTVVAKRESSSKDDRGIVRVETRGYNQDGTLVCIFRRAVLVPKQSYLDARGGDQPGRPAPGTDRRLHLRVDGPARQEHRHGVPAAPSCPRCRGQLASPGLMRSAWTCPEHGAVAPLQAAHPGTSEQLAHLAARSMVPVWLPWPLPSGWLVSGIQHAGDEHTGPVASVVACAGPNPLPRQVFAQGEEYQPAADLVLVAEQPAVGLGAHLAGLPEVDAGDSLSGALVAGGPQAKVQAAGHPAHLWHVPTAPDRAAYVGEALGVWLWLIMWPPSAGALVLENLHLLDAREPGHPLDVPTGAPSPRLEWGVRP